MPEQQLSKSGTPLGPIGTKVLFENDHIESGAWNYRRKGISRCTSTSIPI